jgi:dsDNA-specific endonuclease/ATPase MutS2
MPEETKIDVGENEEESVDVNLSEEPQKEIEEKVQASEEELDDYSAGVKTRINNLTKRFREEERQKQTAIEYAENVRKENEQLKQRMNALDKGYQEQFESRVSNQIGSAKEILKQAHETGDVDKIVEAQEALADLSVEKGALRSAKAERSVQPAPSQPAPVTTTQAPPQPAAQPDPKAEAWAEKNEWFGQDEVMTYGAFGIHRRLVEDEGFDPQSDEYYAELDNRLRGEFPHKFDSKSKSNGGSRKVASAEASASRNRGGRKTVRLTPSQVAIAKRLNVPLEEYAKYVRD